MVALFAGRTGDGPTGFLAFLGVRKVVSDQIRLAASGMIDTLVRFPGSAQASVAQLVEQLICNQLVVGSSPSAGSLVFRKL